MNRLHAGFVGHLTTSKYATLAKCSQDTALREIEALVKAGVHVRNAAGGRSTSYSMFAGGIEGSADNRAQLVESGL